MKDICLAGGKGASLGQMTQLNIPVPPGFVVLAPAFDHFLEETDLNVEIKARLAKINVQDLNSVDRASNEIMGIIYNANFPKDIEREILKEYKKLKASFVAVRSSATAEDSSVASWAGELESYLNTTKADLLENIKKCWASLFTPRAIFYRFEKGLENDKVSVAVVVQKMIQSEVSGICFTVHPITKDKNQMIIEAGYGLGEAIVGGEITPDSYVVEKDTKNILDKNISEQGTMISRAANGNKKIPVAKKRRGLQKLSDERIKELADICFIIEKSYNYPQDIEWAFEKGKFFIVQSRPITTL
ncbi:MAG TPA: PEP/pyruvate-binding domain-containing protein [Candidatus Bathyarchaeia archaeon]|nr:PEP/pyruvate-binding domain-containing protein [Candidatus Bathyarchaeia archaeon]